MPVPWGRSLAAEFKRNVAPSGRGGLRGDRRAERNTVCRFGGRRFDGCGELIGQWLGWKHGGQGEGHGLLADDHRTAVGIIDQRLLATDGGGQIGPIHLGRGWNGLQQTRNADFQGANPADHLAASALLQGKARRKLRTQHPC